MTPHVYYMRPEAFGSMSRALVATSATSGLSLFFHVLRFLSSPTGSPLVPPSALPVADDICSALSSDTAEQGVVHWPSVLVGVCIGFLLIPLCEAVLTARILVFRAALRRFGFAERAPLYRLL